LIIFSACDILSVGVITDLPHIIFCLIHLPAILALFCIIANSASFCDNLGAIISHILDCLAAFIALYHPTQAHITPHNTAPAVVSHIVAASDLLTILPNCVVPAQVIAHFNQATHIFPAVFVHSIHNLVNHFATHFSIPIHHAAICTTSHNHLVHLKAILSVSAPISFANCSCEIDCL
jgi:hypothetical protein